MNQDPAVQSITAAKIGVRYLTTTAAGERTKSLGPCFLGNSLKVLNAMISLSSVLPHGGEREVPGSNPASAGIFSGSSHTSDLKIGTPVATLPGAWRYRVSTGTGRPGVSIL